MQPYSGFFRRFMASIIDIFVIILLFFLIQLIVETLDGTFFYVLLFLTMWIYFALQESSTRKGTVGKQAMNLIVTDLRGNRISFMQATNRFIMKIISAIPLFTGFLSIFFTAKKQAFHDIIAKTVVFIQED